jgi:hypothetical protein
MISGAGVMSASTHPGKTHGGVTLSLPHAFAAFTEMSMQLLPGYFNGKITQCHLIDII